MGPTWVLSAPDGSLVGPMNLAIGGSYWYVAIWIISFNWEHPCALSLSWSSIGLTSVLKPWCWANPGPSMLSGQSLLYDERHCHPGCHPCFSGVSPSCPWPGYHWCHMGVAVNGLYGSNTKLNPWINPLLEDWKSTVWPYWSQNISLTFHSSDDESNWCIPVLLYRWLSARLQ